MTHNQKTGSINKSFTSIILALFFIYFLYFMIEGSSGFLNLITLNKKVSVLQSEYLKLEKIKNTLLIKNRGLLLASLDLDIVEEESKKLGYANNSETIFLIKGE